MRYRIQQVKPETLKTYQQQFCASRAEADTQAADTGIAAAEYGFEAVSDGKLLGAAWAWNLENEGETPEIYVYMQPESRSCGIGTDLVRTLTDYLALCGYPEIFATVRRDNYAVLLFGAVGFRPVKEVDEVYTLRFDLKSAGQIQLGY
ncbi:MAG: GNAT family N-acetyltransferase [Eubacterium sp.]|nr:GNAT family N-acetyltransferase [Eubacterium sp.]